MHQHHQRLFSELSPPHRAWALAYWRYLLKWQAHPGLSFNLNTRIKLRAIVRRHIAESRSHRRGRGKLYAWPTPSQGELK